MKIALALLSATLAAASAHATDDACSLQPLHPAGSSVDAGSLHLDLGAPDNVSKPTAWEGPITVSRQGRKVCTVKDNVAIVSPPLMLGNRRFLLVPTYSGSESIFYVVDTQDCSVRWQSQPYAGDAVIKKNTVDLHDAGRARIGAQCVPDSPTAGS
jgi:hypothetical protein